MHFVQKFDQKFEHYSCVTRTISNASWPSLLSVSLIQQNNISPSPQFDHYDVVTIYTSINSLGSLDTYSAVICLRHVLLVLTLEECSTLL